MPYMVNKPFRACGRRLEAGEIIDAGRWKTKNSLLSLGWISFVNGDTDAEGANRGTNEGINKGTNEGTNEGINRGTNEGTNEGVKAQDDSQNMLEGSQEALETPGDLICPDCGKKCGNKAALTAHMKTHVAE